MKTRETKQRDLNALTESLQNSKSAMVVSFTKVTVNKDQEFRNSLREAGAKYQVVKNTLARIAVKDTQYEQVTEHFKGVTALAWTDSDPVVLTKAISKFMKDNADIYTFKTGVVDGRLIDLTQLQTIASLPSKEELISKLLYVLNAQAQRIVTVINAVPRDLAVVIKQIGESKPAAAEEVSATPTEAPPTVEAAPAVEEVAEAPVEAAPAAAVEEVTEAQAEATAAAEEVAETLVEAAPAAEVETEPVVEEKAEVPVVEAETAAEPAAEEVQVETAEETPAVEEETKEKAE